MFARFTMTLYDARHEDSTLFSFIDFIDADHTQELISSILAMWDIYEIAGETVGQQKKFMHDTYDEYKNYYATKIQEYEKKLEWTDMATVTSHTESDATGLHSELPNKQIDPDDYYAYPTDTDKRDDNSDSTVTDPSKLLSLRRQYLSQIKDYYREFALRFANDFLHLF